MYDYAYIIALYNRLTQQRADWMDNLQHIYGSRMSLIDGLTTQRTDDMDNLAAIPEARMANVDFPISNVRALKSSQSYGPIFMSYTEEVIDVTISSVDPVNCLISYSYYYSLAVPNYNPVAFRLLNSTTVRLYKGQTTDTPALSAFFTVLEFQPPV